jgi:hypothetical protein
MKVYDRFAERYIDETEIEVIAPPERYVMVSEKLLIENAAKWIVEGLTQIDKEREDKTE